MRKSIRAHRILTRPRRTALSGFFTGFFVAIVVLPTTLQADPPERSVGPNLANYQETVRKGIEYLTGKGMSENGAYSPFMGSGPTSLAVTALLRHGVGPDDPRVAESLEWLQSQVREDGGIYGEDSHFQNYETCVGLVAFQAANADGRYDDIVKRAALRIRGYQYTESSDKDPSDLYYGGAGYGATTRPDLSNTAYLLEALKTAGAKEDDEAIQKAMVFVSRCQNLESPHNTTPFAAKTNDGGFYYTPCMSRQDRARMTEDGALESYGSMSYAGLKSMIYAGLKDDDPRVRAAVRWIRANYTVEEHPGMGTAGLFYYYHTFAKSLDVLGKDIVEDKNGAKHDWRRDLAEELARRQSSDGSWANRDSRWMEGDSNLATSFALLAMSYCGPEEYPSEER